MTDPTIATGFGQVATVFVPVADQERALEFYVDTLGFEKRADFSYGDGSRWVEVAPPGSANALALVPPSEGRAVSGDQTHCALTAVDIQSEHARLLERGVDVDREIAGAGTRREGLVALDASIPDPVPAQFFFRDPDYNRFLVVPG